MSITESFLMQVWKVLLAAWFQAPSSLIARAVAHLPLFICMHLRVAVSLSQIS